jgi:cytoskeletal protein RodZ
MRVLLQSAVLAWVAATLAVAAPQAHIASFSSSSNVIKSILSSATTSTSTTATTTNNATIAAHSTFTTTTSATPTATAIPPGFVPDVVLTPTVHPSVDISATANLNVSQSVSLFYGDSALPASNANAYAATFNLGLKYPAVVLEHAGDLISDVVCGSNLDTMTLTFATAEAYEVALEWPSGEFIVVSFNDGCNPSDQRAFHM